MEVPAVGCGELKTAWMCTLNFTSHVDDEFRLCTVVTQLQMQFVRGWVGCLTGWERGETHTGVGEVLTMMKKV